MQRLYMHSSNGAFYAVTDEPAENPRSVATAPAPANSFFARARSWLDSLF
jgi:hypothetical protein